MGNMEKSQGAIIQQYEAIREAAYKTYSITISDDRRGKDDESNWRHESTNRGLKELLGTRKKVALSLVENDLLDKKESLELFEHLNKMILQYLHI